MANKLLKNSIFYFGILFSIFCFLFSVPFVQAATSYFSPSSGNFTTGGIFTVNLLVNTEGVSINNVEATINFPSGLLEIVSISKSGSIFSLWVEEPAFSNYAGTLSFNGGLPTPGFTGTAGKILSAVFRVKKAGSASLIFSSAAIRANDGYGTDVFKTSAQALFNLISEEKPLPPSEIAIGTPVAPNISSLTHPDPNKWYADNNPKFIWSVPSEIVAVRILYDKYPYSVPTVVYKPAIAEKEIKGIKDGIWYLHAQFQNKKGWGAISHFRFQIDTVPPNPFSIKFVSGSETYNPQPQVFFNTSDELSGIYYYKLKIGMGDYFEQSSDIFLKNNPYILPKQSPGKRTLIVQAFDLAGNSSSDVQEFEVKALDTPTITEYPKNLSFGEILIIKGKTYANSQVQIWLQREDGEPSTENISVNNEDGLFVYTHTNNLKSGNYKFWVEVADITGARSLASDSISFVVGPPVLLRFGSTAINYLGVLIPLVILVFALAFVIFFGWHKYVSFKKRLRKEVLEAETIAEEDAMLLKSHTRRQIDYLEKIKEGRNLTREEEKTLESMKKYLDFFEKRGKKQLKEIRDIKREIK